MLDELDQLAAAVKELAALDTFTLADSELTELVVSLSKLRNSLEAVDARVAAEWANRRTWAADGARTPAAWLARETRAPKPECGAKVRSGRQMRECPLAAAAWESGDIGPAHFKRLAAARTERTAGDYHRDEALLVGYATTLTFAEFAQAIDYWQLHADPDGTDDNAMQRRDRRRVSLDQTISGMYSGSILLDPITGSIVHRELKRLDQQLFADDWAAAKRALGRDPHPFELDRTPDQRRADALALMASRSASFDPAAGRTARPLFTVVLGADQLKRLCELADGTVIPPSQLAGWIDDADLEAMLFDTLGERVLKVSRQRNFRGAVRRVLEVRDRRCYHPYCDEPADRCEGDHIVPYSSGGLTSQDNGHLACGFHNRRRWNQRRSPDNDPDNDPDDDPDDS